MKKIKINTPKDRNIAIKMVEILMEWFVMFGDKKYLNAAIEMLDASRISRSDCDEIKSLALKSRMEVVNK